MKKKNLRKQKLNKTKNTKVEPRNLCSRIGMSQQKRVLWFDLVGIMETYVFLLLKSSIRVFNFIKILLWKQLKWMIGVCELCPLLLDTAFCLELKVLSALKFDCFLILSVGQSPFYVSSEFQNLQDETMSLIDQ